MTDRLTDKFYGTSEKPQLPNVVYTGEEELEEQEKSEFEPTQREQPKSSRSPSLPNVIATEEVLEKQAEERRNPFQELFQEHLGPVSTPETQVQSIYDEYEAKEFEDTGFFGDVVLGVQQGFESMWNNLQGVSNPEESLKRNYEMFGNNPNVDDPGYWFGSLVAQVVPSAVAILTAAPTAFASVAAVTGMYGAMAAGSAKIQMHAFELEHPEVQMSKFKKESIAIGAGLIEAGIELASSLFQFKAYKGIGQKALLNASDDVGNAFIKGQTKAGSKLIVKYLNTMLPRGSELVTGSLTEGLEEVLQEIGGNAMQRIYNEDTNLFENIESAAFAGIAGGLLLGGTVGRHLSHAQTMQDMFIARDLVKHHGYEWDQAQKVLFTKHSLEQMFDFDYAKIQNDKQAVKEIVDFSNKTVDLLSKYENVEWSRQAGLTELITSKDKKDITKFTKKLLKNLDLSKEFSQKQVMAMVASKDFNSYWATFMRESLTNVVKKHSKTLNVVLQDLKKPLKGDNISKLKKYPSVQGFIHGTDLGTLQDIIASGLPEGSVLDMSKSNTRANQHPIKVKVKNVSKGEKISIENEYYLSKDVGEVTDVYVDMDGYSKKDAQKAKLTLKRLAKENPAVKFHVIGEASAFDITNTPQELTNKVEKLNKRLDSFKASPKIKELQNKIKTLKNKYTDKEGNLDITNKVDKKKLKTFETELEQVKRTDRKKYSKILSEVKGLEDQLEVYNTLYEQLTEQETLFKRDAKRSDALYELLTPKELRSLKRIIRKDYNKVVDKAETILEEHKIHDSNKLFLDFIHKLDPDFKEQHNINETTLRKNFDAKGDVVLTKEKTVVDDDTGKEKTIKETRGTIYDVMLEGSEDVNVDHAVAQYAVYLDGIEQTIANNNTHYVPSPIIQSLNMVDIYRRADFTFHNEKSLQKRIKMHEKRIAEGERFALKIKNKNHYSRYFSLSRNFNLIGAERTGRAIVKMSDVDILNRRKALDFVTNEIYQATDKDGNFIFDRALTLDYMYAAENQQYLDDHPYKEKLIPIVNKIRSWWEMQDNVNKAHGIYAENFQQTKINYLTEQKSHLQQRLDNLQKRRGKAGEEARAKVRNQLTFVEEMIKRFEQRDYRYVPIPYLQFVIDKVKFDTEFKKRTMKFLTSHSRRTDFFQEFMQSDLMQDVEVTLDDLFLSYATVQGRDLAIANVYQAAVQDGLIRPLKDASSKPHAGFTTANPNMHPVFSHIIDAKGRKRRAEIHNSLVGVLQTQSKVYDPTLYYRIVMRMKMWAFGRPSVMTIYDTVQALTAGTFDIPHLKQAWYDVRNNTAAHQRFVYSGGQSSPISMPEQRLIDVTKIAMENPGTRESILLLKSFGVDLKRMLENTKGDFQQLKQKHSAVRLDENKRQRVFGLNTALDAIQSVYNVTHDLAWTGDNLIRQMTYNKLERKGYSSQDAGYLTSLIHGQYADVPKRSRMQLNSFLFTPTYKIVMGKWYTNMVKSAYKVAFQTAQAKPTDYQLAQGLVRLITAKLAIDYLLTKHGMDRLEFGRKYKTTVHTDAGVKDFNVTLVTPDALFFKYLAKLKNVITGRRPVLKELVNQFSSELTPALRITRDVYFNNRSIDGKKIYNISDPIHRQFKDQALYMLDESIQLFKGVRDSYELRTDTTLEPKINARKALREEYGHIIGYLINQFSFAYYGYPDHMKKLREIRQIQRDFEENPNEHSLRKLRTIINRSLK